MEMGRANCLFLAVFDARRGRWKPRRPDTCGAGRMVPSAIQSFDAVLLYIILSMPCIKWYLRSQIVGAPRLPLSLLEWHCHPRRPFPRPTNQRMYQYLENTAQIVLVSMKSHAYSRIPRSTVEVLYLCRCSVWVAFRPQYPLVGRRTVGCNTKNKQ